EGISGVLAELGTRLVGRQGLEPWTLGLKARRSSCPRAGARAARSIRRLASHSVPFFLADYSQRRTRVGKVLAALPARQGRGDHAVTRAPKSDGDAVRVEVGPVTEVITRWRPEPSTRRELHWDTRRKAIDDTVAPLREVLDRYRTEASELGPEGTRSLDAPEPI